MLQIQLQVVITKIFRRAKGASASFDAQTQRRVRAACQSEPGFATAVQANLLSLARNDQRGNTVILAACAFQAVRDVTLCVRRQFERPQRGFERVGAHRVLMSTGIGPAYVQAGCSRELMK